MNALLVSAQDADRRAFDAILSGTQWALIAVPDLANAIAELSRAVFPIVLYDRDLSGGPWQRTVKELSAAQAGTCIILLSSVSDQYLWDEVVQHGGFDVLARPFEKQQVLSTIDFAYTHWRTAWPAVANTVT